MIFVDTSVWVAAFRRGTSPEAEQLGVLLDRDDVALAAPVRIELLSGASKVDLPRLKRVLSALPVFFPTEATWWLIESWLERAIAVGERFGFADLLIAAIATEGHGMIWSLDGDFDRMARIGLAKIYVPSGR